jgi:hypothetical protein
MGRSAHGTLAADKDKHAAPTFCAFLVHWFRHEWASVLFVVCAVTVLHHTGPLKAVSHLSLLMLSQLHAHLASEPVAAPSKDIRVWLVTIDPDDFESRFEGRRPLPRCPMADDLEKILDSNPRVLAIDLDLSPITGATSDEKTCQTRLDKMLKRGAESPEAHGTRIVVLAPFAPPSDPPPWMKEQKGVKFANAMIEVVQELAIEFSCHESGLAEMAYVAKEGHRPGQCSDEREFQLEMDDEEQKKHPINYAAYKERTIEKHASQLAKVEMGMEDNVVFYGNRSGTSDAVITPVGRSLGG